MDVGLDFNSYVNNPDQEWLQSEPAQIPIPQGDSEYNWYLWRQNADQGVENGQAWESIHDDQGAGPSNYLSSNLAGPSTYHQPFNHVQDTFDATYGTNNDDYAQNDFVSMSDILPLPSRPLSFDDEVTAPPVSNAIHPTVIATVPAAIDVVKRSPTPPLDPTVSPLESLGDVFETRPYPRAIAPLTLSVAIHFKRLVAPSSFANTRPVKSGSGPEYSSSSINRPPKVKKRKPEQDGPSSVSLPAGTSSHRPVIPIQGVTMDTIRAYITPEALRAGRPVPLFKNLRQRVSGDDILPPVFSPNLDETLEIVTALKKHAPGSYLRAMADDVKYTTVLSRWLRRCIKEPKEWGKVTAPLIDVLSRSDMPVNIVIDLKFGKQVKAAKTSAIEGNLPNAKDIAAASDRYIKYLTEVLLPANRRVGPVKEEEGAAKKRKVEDGSARDVTDKPGSSSKAPAPTSGKDKEKAPAKPSSDMSFFTPAPVPKSSSFQPRAKLPDIKKRDPPSAPSAPPAGLPSLLDRTLALLKKGNDTTSPNHTIPQQDAPNLRPAQKQPNKKGHMVKFVDLIPDGGPLEAVRLFTEAPHELEPAPWQTDQGVHGSTTHDLDMGEGKALRMTEEMEEEITWYEPYPYVYTEDPDFVLHGPTPETVEQDNRELGILAVNYPAGQVPLNPDETGVKIIERGDSTMIWEPPVSHPAQPAYVPPQPSVTALLGQLNPSLFAPPIPQPPPVNYYGAYPQPQQQPQGYEYGYTQQPPAYPQPPQPQGYEQRGGGWAPHNNQYDNGRQDHRANGRRGGGGGGGWNNERGGGRGRKGGGNRHEVCKFWLRNDCRLGDDCEFRHSR